MKLILFCYKQLTN